MCGEVGGLGSGYCPPDHTYLSTDCVDVFFHRFPVQFVAFWTAFHMDSFSDVLYPHLNAFLTFVA